MNKTKKRAHKRAQERNAFSIRYLPEDLSHTVANVIFIRKEFKGTLLLSQCRAIFEACRLENRNYFRIPRNLLG